MMDPLFAGLKKGLEKYIELIADGTVVEMVKKMYEVIDWMMDLEFYKKWLKLNRDILEEVEILGAVEERHKEMEEAREKVKEE
jgi:hypothetical protein